MNKRRKNKSKRTKRKSKKSGRMVNFMGALLLEVCGMVLLLTLFFTFRESPAEYEARTMEPENPRIEFVQPKEQVESYMVGLFEKNRR